MLINLTVTNVYQKKNKWGKFTQVEGTVETEYGNESAVFFVDGHHYDLSYDVLVIEGMMDDEGASAFDYKVTGDIKEKINK